MISLISSSSIEEIFTYVQSKKFPKVLASVRRPILVLWAEHDEFADRSAADAAIWFNQNIKGKHKVVVVPGAKHSFSAKGGSASGGKGAEKSVAKEIKTFING